MEHKYTYLAEELISKGIRPSHQRLKILEHFHKFNNHPTVEEIYKELKPIMPTLTKATIYNTLKIFVKEQIINEVHIEDNEIRYDLFAESHGHFKCNECGTVYDFNIEIEKIPTVGLDEFRVETKNVYFKGICQKCLSSNKTKK